MTQDGGQLLAASVSRSLESRFCLSIVRKQVLSEHFDKANRVTDVHFTFQMDFTAFRMAAADRRAAFEEVFGRRDSSDEDWEYDFREPDPHGPPFSIEAPVDREGERFVEESILFTWAEFLELFEIADFVLKTKIPGRPFHLPPIDQFFVFILWLTSD
jgi:hypothetical protein